MNPASPTPISRRYCTLLTAALVLLLVLALAGCGGKKARSCKLSGFTAAPGSPFAVGDTPDAVTVADFDGDGHPDLATANIDSDDVSVLLGDDKAGFADAPGSPFAIGTGPEALAVGDFDGDGRPDLAVAEGDSNDVSVLLGDGSGGFTAAPGSPFTVGEEPFSVAVGDFNGDGHPDLATANGFSIDVSVLLGDGLGGFTAAPGSPFAVGADSVAVGDFNGDGHPDLAVGSTDVSVLLGDGKGGFKVTPDSPFAVGKSPNEIAVGDFDGDGHTDLATVNEDSNNVSVLLGDGKGGFTAAPGSPVAVGKKPISVAVDDFDGDGHPDLVVANNVSNDVSVLLGDGSGGFAVAPGSPFAVGTEPFSVAVGDFDGDGHPDLAVSSQDSNDVSVLLGRCN